MKEHELTAALQRGPEAARLEETRLLCRQVLQRAEPRTGFWQFLSDILPFVGLRLWVGQVCVLALLLLDKPTAQSLTFYTPLLVLVCLPSFYESRIYGMAELEAATRASGIQLLLGKLVLSGGANLVVLTLAVGVRILAAEVSVLQLILYALVPFLCCTCATLWSLRTCRPRREWLAVVLCVGLSAFFAGAARLLPELYARSAVRVWAVAFVLFFGFFVKELLILLGQYGEGRVYGTID